jgi:hypothetical protein
MRRMFRGGVIFLFADDNLALPLLFDDPLVVYVSVRWRGLQLPNRGQVFLARALRFFLVRALWRSVQFHGTSIYSAVELRDCMARMMRNAADVAVPIPPNAVRSPYLPTYFQMLRHYPRSPLRLPDEQRETVRRRIGEAIGRPVCEWRLCCLYLRNRDASAPETASRNGSPVEEFAGAVAALKKRNYLCILVGDRARGGGGDLWDAARLGVPADLLYLYAATEADLFIGEAGGGSYLPGISVIPTLIVNSYPHGYARFHATELLKPSATEANSAEEITAAVQDFLDHSYPGEPYGLKCDVGWFPDADARLSPIGAWRFAP